MKRLGLALGVTAICWMLLSADRAAAAPIFSVTTTIDVGFMTVATSGDLRLNWGAPEFDGWILEGTGNFWYDGSELGAYSEVGREDLRYFEGGSYPPYYGHADAYATLNIPFTVDGEGAASLAVPFHAEYDTGAYPEPDAYGGGPDFCYGNLLLVNGEDYSWDNPDNFRYDLFQIDRPGTYDYLLQAGDLQFGAGDSGFLRFFAYAESAVYYNDIPRPGNQTPAPVPEPATLLLVGAGMLAGAAAKKKMRS